jgi:hypothetical protein
MVLVLFVMTIHLIISANLSIAAPLKAVLALAGMAYGLFILYKHGLLLSQWSIKGLQYRDDQWFVRDGLNRQHLALLSGDSTVTTWVSILIFDCPVIKKNCSCVIFYDALPIKHYKQLLMRLVMMKNNTTCSAQASA